MLYIPFNNQYVSLGSAFYQEVEPRPVAKPGLIKFNEVLAAELGITMEDCSQDEIAAVFAGNQVPGGAAPMAMAYSGHQFGHFNPRLGDGRAILLGQLSTESGNYDIHLKGSGQTAFSRNGDGRAALGPVLREYLVSEAMYQLGVPTTRALAAVTTGEEVIRDRLIPGGVITRVAKSFVRIGTFQHFASRGDLESLKKLADYMIENHYPELKQADNPYLELIKAVIAGQATLIAKWMQTGFIHGVMNTDNMSIVCETIDYGPCAFMDGYQHDQVYSSIDQHGRYAYHNQPSIALWNLIRLAETLVPFIDDEQDTALQLARDALETFQPQYERAWLLGMREKCGFSAEVANDSEDKQLIENLFDIMHEATADFTLTFYYLSRLTSDKDALEQLKQLFSNSKQLDAWLEKYQQRVTLEKTGPVQREQAMQQVNPVYIPRNHLIEEAIRAAEDRGDFSVFHELHAVLQQPYQLQQGRERYQQPPKPEEVVEYTFCGT